MAGSEHSTRAHWDAMAEGYDAAKARNSVYYDTLKQLVDRSVPPDRRERILELGCGTGQILAHLGPTAGVGIDASPRMIDRARSAHAACPNLDFNVGDATTPGAPPGVFDAVVAADLLEHVADWPALLAAATRACRPGGRIVLTTPNPMWAAPLLLLETLRLKMPEGPHRYVHRTAIAARLRELGCRVTSVGTHALLPVGLAGLGPGLSAAAARLPILARLGVIQLVVAERGEEGPGP